MDAHIHGIQQKSRVAELIALGRLAQENEKRLEEINKLAVGLNLGPNKQKTVTEDAGRQQIELAVQDFFKDMEEIENMYDLLKLLVHTAYMNEMIPFYYREDTVYTMDHMMVYHNKDSILAFAKSLMLQPEEVEREQDFIKIKNRVIMELFNRKKLAKKGSEEEARAKEAHRTRIKRIFEALDEILAKYKCMEGCSTDCPHHNVKEDQKNDIISALAVSMVEIGDITRYTDMICDTFLQILLKDRLPRDAVTKAALTEVLFTIGREAELLHSQEDLDEYLDDMAMQKEDLKQQKEEEKKKKKKKRKEKKKKKKKKKVHIEEDRFKGGAVDRCS